MTDGGERRPRWLSRFVEERRPVELRVRARELLRYIGPGLLVTVGFIDPGNWASNVAAGSGFGYRLLWMVTLSTLLLILLQHNAAHLGIATGDCLAEAATRHLRRRWSVPILGSSLAATIATAYAELMGGAIALQLLVGLPFFAGILLMLAFVLAMLFTNAYRRIEHWIIGFVSVIGFAFLIETFLAPVDWAQAAPAWVTPSLPAGSLPIVMSVLGAVVMPHNLFLHSEIIQSRQWNLGDERTIRRQLRYEFLDTLFSMSVGWAINSAMILLAAATFFRVGTAVTDLGQAKAMLEPLLGPAAAILFAVALLFSGMSSSITAGMTGGTIFAGFFLESYDAHDKHSRTGILVALLPAAALALLTRNVYQGLIVSQLLLSIQLPITIFLQLRLTSSRKVMGRFRNSVLDSVLLWACAAVVTVLNVLLFRDLLAGFF